MQMNRRHSQSVEFSKHRSVDALQDSSGLLEGNQGNLLDSAIEFKSLELLSGFEPECLNDVFRDHNLLIFCYGQRWHGILPWVRK